MEAARALFAERGNDVRMPEVARLAGGGTLYRNFPTREALVEAGFVGGFIPGGRGGDADPAGE